MFESKNDIAMQVLRTERIRTILFISMINAIPISILYIEDNDQETIKRGVVHSVAGISSSQAPWQRAINGSFSFVSHEDNWFQISNTYAVSFTELNDRKSFFKHKDALRSLHFDPYYMRGSRIRITRGMIKLDEELNEKLGEGEDLAGETYGYDTKFYRILGMKLNKT